MCSKLFIKNCNNNKTRVHSFLDNVIVKLHLKFDVDTSNSLRKPSKTDLKNANSKTTRLKGYLLMLAESNALRLFDFYKLNIQKVPKVYFIPMKICQFWV